jgi:hypothetical protein
MNATLKLAALLTSGAALAACVVTPKVAPAGTFVPTKSAFAVRLGEAWTQYPRGMFLELNADVLTQDGLLLNRILMASVPAGKSLVNPPTKSVDVPKYAAGSSALEQTEFVRASFERLGFANVATSNLRPETVDGQDGTRFDVVMTIESGLRYKGDVLIAEKAGQLHIVGYVATEMQYFERDKPSADAIIASVNLN